MVHSAQRYARQRILAEIGSEGQNRLEEAVFSFQGALSTGELRFAKLYAERAGLRVEGSPRTKDEGEALSPVEGALSDAFRHSSSRDIGLGAAHSLGAILNILNLTP